VLFDQVDQAGLAEPVAAGRSRLGDAVGVEQQPVIRFEHLLGDLNGGVVYAQGHAPCCLQLAHQLAVP
jgi:hypothetical protein